MKIMQLPLIAAVLLSVPVLSAEPVIDDRELLRNFSTRLGEMADAGKPMIMRDAREALEKNTGCAVVLPPPSDACTPDEEHGIYERCLPAVVVFGSVYDCGKCDDWHLGALATGWVASSDGIVVTNYHVIDKDNDHALGVMTPDGEVFPVIEVLTGDKEGDMAAVRIDTDGRRLPYLRLASGARVGEKVSVISNPRRRMFVYTSGVVSRFHHMPSRGASRPIFMSVTADFAVGSSGGPIINAEGAVVGMVSSTQAARASARRTDGEAASQEGAVQMVFKDCVSPQVMNSLLRYGDED